MSGHKEANTDKIHPMATQKDVAKLANVSFITVSRVINNMGNVKPETKARVEKAIKELNYYPNSIAQGLNRNRVKTLAVVVSLAKSETVEENSYYTRLLSGVERYCIETHYDMLISSKRGKMKDIDSLEPYYNRKADGIIVLGAKPTEEQLQKINDDDIPCVIIGDKDEKYHLNVIDSDNYKGVYNATEHLIKLGHRRIGFIRTHITPHNIAQRLKGWQDAMNDNGLSMEDLLLTGYFSKESGKEVCKEILKMKDKPTAIISATDIMSLGVYEELKERGFNLPGDFSLIGFDGHELCNYTTPPLATLKQPLEDMGYEGAKMLISQIENEDYITQHKTFPVTFIKGGSIGGKK